MAPVITRLLLTLSLFVAAPLMYVVIMLTAFDILAISEDEIIFAIANLLTGGFIVLGWILILMHEIRWNPWRIGMTVGVGIASVLIATSFALIAILTVRGDESLYIFLSGLIWLVLWLFGTSLAWMELPNERRKRYAVMGLEKVPCPSCGYNLSGLKETKCPECGASFTIDSLFAAVQEQARPL